ncbi:MAG: hypothetical protein E6J90_45665 [Deltaproteobacteria bacterium]|nr:MAG: hypothetical protein E6J90_45665 [Deltaproteobacteria bacterium]
MLVLVLVISRITCCGVPFSPGGLLAMRKSTPHSSGGYFSTTRQPTVMAAPSATTPTSPSAAARTE